MMKLPHHHSNRSGDGKGRDRNRSRSNSCFDLFPEESFSSTRCRTPSIDNVVVTASTTRRPRDPTYQQQQKSHSCSDLSVGDLSAGDLSTGDEVTTNHQPDKGSNRWWNFMSSSSFTTSTTPPIKSRHSDRVKSRHHHSLDFDNNNNDNNNERAAVVSSPRYHHTHTSASSNHNNNDDDLNRRVAQMLGTSTPHCLDYPAFIPPVPSSASSSALRRRERRLRERYANQHSQSHDNIMEAASITGRNRKSHDHHYHHGPPHGHASQSRQHSYEPSIQCNPVSSMVLQNLPLIQVRYEDLFPDEIHDNTCATTTITNNYDRDNCSSSSISIGINHLSYTCTICADDIEVDSMAIRLPCSHLYHNCESCILTWFIKYNTCPICRYTLPTDTDLCRNHNTNFGIGTRNQMKALHQKHYQSKRNETDQARPMRYTRQEIERLSLSLLRQYYKAWAICTYNSHDNPKKLELPFGTESGHDKVDSTVIDYLVEENVIQLNPTNDDPNKSTQHGADSQQQQFGNLSVKDLMSLVPPTVIATNRMVEKQDLIDFLQQRHEQHSYGLS